MKNEEPFESHQAALFNEYYEGVEHPMAGRYWDNETPKIYKVASMELRHYVEAGKLQMYVPNNGYTGKAIVLTVGEQTPEDLAGLLTAFNDIFFESVSEVVPADRWHEILEQTNNLDYRGDV